MRSLREIQPTGVIARPDLGFPDLMENFFIRLFYEPRIKELIGWIGIGYRESSSRGWTFRIKGQKGIYCLQYGGSNQGGSVWNHGTFYIQYFPAMDEDVLDSFSIRENILRQDPLFEQLLRERLPEDDPVDSQFIVGKLVLSVDNEEENLFLSLCAPEKWREILRNGLDLPRNNGAVVEAVPMGGIDRDVPAYDLSWPLFDKIILTVAYHFKQHPFLVTLKKRPAQVFEITDKNHCYSRQARDIEELCLSVGFGPVLSNGTDDPRLDWATNFFPTDMSPSSSKLIWTITTQDPDPEKVNPLWWEASSWEETLRTRGTKALGLDYRPPLLVLTGFLGSGKTTLLNKIIEHYSGMHNKFVAVIQNEVGQINVDGKSTDGAIAVSELEDGCVCCTLLGEFRRTVRHICIEYEPDLIIVETTGVADPNNILAELPQLKPFVRFDSIITVVDGPNFKRNIKEYPVATAQIETADLVLLNKVDLMDDQSSASVQKTIETINPRATIFHTINAQIPPGLLFCTRDEIDGSEALQSSALFENSPIERSNMNIHSQKIETVSITLEGCFKEAELIQLLDNLPDSVYRLKGFVNIEGFSTNQLLQYVAGRYELESLPNPVPGSNRLVFIGRQLDEDTLKTSFAHCLRREKRTDLFL
ncbi:MAG: GTP-binding protein [Syntrophobacterales bacterium]|nr:GTP-binding protein [Syntrophobacterales bacterium]